MFFMDVSIFKTMSACNLGRVFEGKKMKKLILIPFLLIFASSAGASVYKWVDERGVINFVDDANKVPPAYRDSAEEVKTPKMAPQPSRPVKTSAEAPPISQVLVREGDLAIKLVEALKVGRAQSEAEAESMLASAGIAPKNGWIADYPVTPDVIGELQNAVTEAAGSGKLAVNQNEAMKGFQDVIAQQGLPVRAGDNPQYAGTGEPGAEASAPPPPSYPEEYEPSEVNDYYGNQGPPVVTYYPPPPDYSYLYAWVPYPFWFGGFWFPGFYCLHDFHRVVFHDGHRGHVSNHFRDSKTGGVGRIDPARRPMGNSVANASRPTRGFANGPASTPRRSADRTVVNHPGGLPDNRAGYSRPGVRSRTGSARPAAGYGPSSTAYPSGRSVPSGRPAYRSSPGPSASFSHPGAGISRSFASPPSGSGGGPGSRGFSGGAGRSFGGGGGRGHS